jgi:hypothetical protein
VQNRAPPETAAVAGSPAAVYAQWVRVAGLPADGAAVATVDGFQVTADRAVVLANFTVVEGKVTGFDECIDGACTPIAARVTIPSDCAPGDGCPHLVSDGGGLQALLRATITLRWPEQIVLYQLVPTGDRQIASVEEPTQRQFHYDNETQSFVAIFPDRPTAGTRSELLITFSDGTVDYVTIFYGA